MEKKHIRIEYCPTDDMLGDFFTKPTQGTKFRTFRRRVMGMTESASETNSVRKECVGDCGSRIRSESVESELNTSSQMDASWIQVVGRSRKKKADVLMTANLGGKQSEKHAKLTLFTKSKLVKQ